MLKFKEIQQLNEAGLKLNGKAYPNFGNVIIAAGGAGSGKGFVLKNVLLFKGKTFDVDAIKTKILKSKENSRIWKEFENFANENGLEKTRLTDLDLGVSKDVSTLHKFVKEMGFSDKFKDIFFKVVSKTKRKPNVIFDITLKKISALGEDVAPYVEMGGYDPKNVHLVWILNSFEIALKQNEKRDRKVSMDVMIETHEGAAISMKKIMQNAEEYRDLIDGDIWIVPNKVGVDNSAIKNTNSEVEWKGKKYNKQTFDEKSKESIVVEKYSAICIKKAGESPMSYDEIQSNLFEKIRDYVPKDVAKIF